MRKENADRASVEDQMIEEEKKRKVKIKVQIETVNRERLVGYLYLDKTQYRRISDYLNDTQIDFLILTDVKDMTREGKVNFPFLALNKRHVVMITESI